MFVDQSGQHIKFPQYPGLTFSSMEAAFTYIEAHAKLQKQRTAWAKSQSAVCDVQRSRWPRPLDPSERIWQFDSSLEPNNVKPAVRLPIRYLEQAIPHVELAAEALSQDTLKSLNSVYPSSRSSPPEIPPHTLFAESTPHARDIQVQRRVELPAEELQLCTVRSQAVNGFDLQPLLPWPAVPDQGNTPVEDHFSSHSNHELLSSSPSSKDDGILAQPQSSYGSYPLASSYSGTVLPQTLAKKDMRALGVPLTADIDEYVPILGALFPPIWPLLWLTSPCLCPGCGLVSGCGSFSMRWIGSKPLPSKTGQLLRLN